MFDGVPGPSPWYLADGQIILDGFHWERPAQDSIAAGKTLLVGKHGPIAILGLQNFVKPIGNSTILIWHQAATTGILTPPVHFLIVDLQQLTPLGKDLHVHYDLMKSREMHILLGGSPSAAFNVETTVVNEALPLNFPLQVKGLGELLLFCDSSGIGISDGWSKANRALIVVNFRSSTYRLYPQDWFNEGSYDFGYQWTTRAIRNLSTNEIHGEGIRIGSFVLDDSFRNLKLPKHASKYAKTSDPE